MRGHGLGDWRCSLRALAWVLSHRFAFGGQAVTQIPEDLSFECTHTATSMLRHRNHTTQLVQEHFSMRTNIITTVASARFESQQLRSKRPSIAILSGLDRSRPFSTSARPSTGTWVPLFSKRSFLVYWVPSTYIK